jgi:general stress protein 26
LSEQEVNDFLDSRPGWMVLSTIGPHGFPHSVPLGYFRLGQEVVLGARAGTQKQRNIEREPKVTLLLEKSEGSHLIGLMINGLASIVTDDAERLELHRAAARGRGVAESELPTQVSPHGIYIRVQRQRVISWEYAD